MTTTATQSSVTPDDVIRLEDEGLFELVDGKLVEKQMGSLATETAGIITFHLLVFSRAHAAGSVFPEQSFQCFPDDPERIRRPDIAFISRERRKQVNDEGHIFIAPDLAIEIVSPNDRYYELDIKLAEYRSAGVRLMWVVNPQARVIRVHRADLSVSELFESDTITGESVLPGFSIAVRDLFPSQPAPHGA